MASSGVNPKQDDASGPHPESLETTGLEEEFAHLSLNRAVYARRSEFTETLQLKVKVGCWNVASLAETEKDLKSWFVQEKGASEGLSKTSHQDEPRDTQQNAPMQLDTTFESAGIQEPSNLEGRDEAVGIYALGLQEVVDINSPAEALRPFTDAGPAQKWKRAIEEALPGGYQLVAETQLTGLLLLVFASAQVAATISHVSTSTIGTGLMGYMGNKGAVAARFVLGETTRLVFINAHLAAGAEKVNLDRRNWDAAQIASRLKFDAFDDGSGILEHHEGIGDEDFAWWFGDLNYRIEGVPGDDVRRLLTLHARNEYDSQQKSLFQGAEVSGELHSPKRSHRESSSDFHVEETDSTSSQASSGSPIETLHVQPVEDLDPRSDPASLQSTLESLLSHDQLRQQQASGKAFHDGWKEGPIDFLPSYKYDVGSIALFDSSEKKRAPSWCDRILYRTRRDKQLYDKRVLEDDAARRRDEEMRARGVDKAAAEDAVLFDYDPDKDAADATPDEYNEEYDEDQDGQAVITKEGYEDRIQLETYTSFQHVLSSDHKPLTATFSLTYDTVSPPLKSKIYHEVARNFDRAENEARPGLTIAVDRHNSIGSDTPSSPTQSAASQIPGETTSAHVDFGELRYLQFAVRHVTLANTGRVPALFHLANTSPENSEESHIPRWLKVELESDETELKKNDLQTLSRRLEPGDAVNLTLIAQVRDFELARRLNRNQHNLADVLVLRVEEGREYFLPLHASWMQTCFGRTIDELTRVPEEGVRTLHDHGKDRASFMDEGVKWSAPRELFRLTAAIEELVERVIAEVDMTSPVDDEHKVAPWDRGEGWPFSKDTWQLEDGVGRDTLKLQIYEGLDSNKPFFATFAPDVSSLSRLELVAETLLDLLESLEDGLIPEGLWAEIETVLNNRERARETLSLTQQRDWVLDTLAPTPTTSICLVLLTSMMAHVASELAPLQMSRPEASSAASAVQAETSPTISKGLIFRTSNTHLDPIVEKRIAVDRSLSRIFANVIIRSPQSRKEKEKRATEARKFRFLEIILRSKWEDGR